jgi:hypothetical protein
VFDRMSKGVREAPSKALIGELASQSGDRPEQAFGENPTIAASVSVKGEGQGKGQAKIRVKRCLGSGAVVAQGQPLCNHRLRAHIHEAMQYIGDVTRAWHDFHI